MRIVAALGGNALLERGEPPESDSEEAHIVTAVRALAPLAARHDLVDHLRQRPPGRDAGTGERARSGHRQALPVRRARRADPGHDRLLAGPGAAERAARPPGGLPGQPDPGPLGRPGLRRPVRSSSARSTTRSRPGPWPRASTGRSARTALAAPSSALARARRAARPARHPDPARHRGRRGLRRRRWRARRGTGRPGPRGGSGGGQGPDRLAAGPRDWTRTRCCCSPTWRRSRTDTAPRRPGRSGRDTPPS